MSNWVTTYTLLLLPSPTHTHAYVYKHKRVCIGQLSMVMPCNL